MRWYIFLISPYQTAPPCYSNRILFLVEVKYSKFSWEVLMKVWLGVRTEGKYNIKLPSYYWNSHCMNLLFEKFNEGYKQQLLPSSCHSPWIKIKIKKWSKCVSGLPNSSFLVFDPAAYESYQEERLRDGITSSQND